MEILEMTKLLAQLPILGFFAWWVWQSNKRWDLNNDQWRQHLAERNSKLEKVLEKISEAVGKLSSKMENRNSQDNV